MKSNLKRSSLPNHVPRTSPADWAAAFHELVDVMAFLRSDMM